MKTTTKGISSSRMWKPLLRTFLLLTVLCLAAKMPNVQAQTVSTSASHGNLIYEGKRGSAALYAADILLLEEKISTITERCFDPVCYAHTHNWEYSRINEKTHTRHCADCGDANDLTSPHRADSWVRDTIFYDGKAYPGKRFTCDCGYQWSMELSHNMIYEAVDEVNHQSRCVLDGTPYCRGCEPSVEEHYAWYYEMGDDAFRHQKICFDCGFQVEEVCSFEETEDDEGRRVCICGRCETREEESETPDEPETGEPPEAPDEPDTEDPAEIPDEPDIEDPPEIGDEPDIEDPPEIGDEPGTEDPPGTGDALITPEMSVSSGTVNARAANYMRVDQYSINSKGGF